MELFAATVSAAGIPAESLTVHDQVSRAHICQASAVSVKRDIWMHNNTFFLTEELLYAAQ